MKQLSTTNKTNVIDELKKLDAKKLGPTELSNKGKQLAYLVTSTKPNDVDLVTWINSNIDKIDETIFANFNNANMVHVLGFTKIHLRKYIDA